jgi:cytoskeletal protein CcmA (bactofilin family)
MFQKMTKTGTSITIAPKSDTALSRKSPPSVISADVNILGNLISDGVLDIDGRVDGNVKCRSATIRRNGRIMGDIVAESVQVFGEVTGTIKAKEVSLFATCRVEGVIMHESLTIEDGAFVDGQFKRMDKVVLDDVMCDDDDDDIDVFRQFKLVN